MRAIAAILGAGFIAALLAAELLLPLRAQTPPASPATLPPGSIVQGDEKMRPRQVLNVEAAGGSQSYLVALGNTAFSSPLIYGPVAKTAGISCNGCHVQGDINARFFIPGLSQRPGGLDPTGHLFNPAADNKLAEHVDIPSLRGIRFTAPYGRDGRIASLREFTRQVIVVEFGGPEPSPLLLDALMAYLNEIDFLPNTLLDRSGRLTAAAAPAAKRGEALFNRPFATMGGQSCASCHVPSADFIDRRSHDVGSGGAFDTPTLRNVRFSAPYFHDGRYGDLAAVIDHFDKAFALALAPAQKADLLAYLQAAGDGEDPFEPVTAHAEMAELASYVGAIATALDGGDIATVRLIVDTVIVELNRVAARFPHGDAARALRRPDRRKDPVDYPALGAALGQITTLADGGKLEAARAAVRAYNRLAAGMFDNYPDF